MPGIPREPRRTADRHRSHGFDYNAIVQHGKLVDTRNATKNVKVGRKKIRKA